MWSKTQYGNCWIEIYYPFLSSNLYQYPWNIPQDEKYNELDKTNFNQFDFSNYWNNFNIRSIVGNRYLREFSESANWNPWKGGWSLNKGCETALLFAKNWQGIAARARGGGENLKFRSGGERRYSRAFVSRNSPRFQTTTSSLQICQLSRDKSRGI